MSMLNELDAELTNIAHESGRPLSSLQSELGKLSLSSQLELARILIDKRHEKKMLSFYPKPGN